LSSSEKYEASSTRGVRILNGKQLVYYVMRSKNEVLRAAAGRLAAERSEADKPAKAHKTIFAPNNIYVLFFLQTFITNYLRHVKKLGRNFK
jgi:hypothetical protein